MTIWAWEVILKAQEKEWYTDLLQVTQQIGRSGQSHGEMEEAELVLPGKGASKKQRGVVFLCQ